MSTYDDLVAREIFTAAWMQRPIRSIEGPAPFPCPRCGIPVTEAELLDEHEFYLVYKSWCNPEVNPDCNWRGWVVFFYDPKLSGPENAFEAAREFIPRGCVACGAALSHHRGQRTDRVDEVYYSVPCDGDDVIHTNVFFVRWVTSETHFPGLIPIDV